MSNRTDECGKWMIWGSVSIPSTEKGALVRLDKLIRN